MDHSGAQEKQAKSARNLGRRWKGDELFRNLAVGINRHVMARSGVKFGRKQEEAIAALLTQRNVEEAARAAGIGTRTLLRWLKIPEFQSAYRQARREAFGQAVARLQKGTSAAATTLLKTMIDPGTPASVKVRAAEAIFNHAAKSIEIEDIEARVAALEQAAASGTPHR
jgi:hypothetical protein